MTFIFSHHNRVNLFLQTNQCLELFTGLLATKGGFPRPVVARAASREFAPKLSAESSSHSAARACGASTPVLIGITSATTGRGKLFAKSNIRNSNAQSNHKNLRNR